MNYRRIFWILLGLCTVCLLIWAGRLIWAGVDLWSKLSQLQALAGDTETLDPVAACALVQTTRDRVVLIRTDAGWLLPAGRAFGWLPLVGGDLRAAPHLLTTADGLTEAGSVLCTALEPLLVNWQTTGALPELAQVSELLVQNAPALQQAAMAVECAQTAWSQVDATSLMPPIARRAALLEEGLPLLQAGLQIALIAPDMLGSNEPRTYLILVQNDDEMRPTGGFISAVGQVTLEEWQMTHFSFADSYTVDDYANKPYPRPPEPLYNYMGADLWLFRDANWSPDFPTSAQQAAYFYEYGQDIEVDGVIALDQYAVELILTAFGELRLEDPAAPPLTAENIRDFMHEAWNPGAEGVVAEWFGERKAFIEELATALRTQLEAAPDSVDTKLLLLNIYRALNERHILIYLDEPAAATIMAGLGWDGALQATQGDYLMVVDANVGFGKVDPLIERSWNYHVMLNADGTASAIVELTYAHRGELQDVLCDPRVSYQGHLTYVEMMERCYYDYLRLYVPDGSQLRSATSRPTPGHYLVRGAADDGQAETLVSEAGKTVFGQLFVLEIGDTLTQRWEYDLPVVVQRLDNQWRYSLLWQKQPGTANIPITVTVTLPQDAQWVSVTPLPVMSTDTQLTFNGFLSTDFKIEVIYE